MLRASKSRVPPLLACVLALPALAHGADTPVPNGPAASWRQMHAAGQRGARTLSRREIFQAIQSHLAQMGVARQEELRPEDLSIQSTLPVLCDDMGLEVKRISYDPLRRETVFELWAAHEAQFLPFAVTTRRNPQSLGLAALPGQDPNASEGSRTVATALNPAARPAPAPAPVLARPGTSATLIMVGQNLRITTAVVPLQPGVQGQCIFVRDLATSRVMKAEVVGAGVLQASL